MPGSKPYIFTCQVAIMYSLFLITTKWCVTYVLPCNDVLYPSFLFVAYYFACYVVNYDMHSSHSLRMTFASCSLRITCYFPPTTSRRPLASPVMVKMMMTTAGGGAGDAGGAEGGGGGGVDAVADALSHAACSFLASGVSPPSSADGGFYMASFLLVRLPAYSE